MFIVIAFILIGGITGYFLHKKELGNIPKFVTVLIWLLLAILGMEVGSNPDIIKGLATIGKEALFITIAAVTGSAFMALLLWKLINKGKK